MKVLPISCRCKLSGLVPHLRQQMTISYSARGAGAAASGAVRHTEGGLGRVLPLHLPPAA